VRDAIEIFDMRVLPLSKKKEDYLVDVYLEDWDHHL